MVTKNICLSLLLAIFVSMNFGVSARSELQLKEDRIVIEGVKSEYKIPSF